MSADDRTEALAALRWRCIGPPRGGRVVAVAGDPSDHATFYFGACAGGIWKTTDGGQYWRCVSDGFLSSAAVGALAVAPSSPSTIYAGMGETAIRIDVSYGDGIYKSDDAGHTWRHVGLRDSKHVGRIVVHPRNPDVVFAAVLGDIFGPHEERGVYRSLDGGGTWTRVLFRDADTGAIDVSMDPHNPRLLFASLWQTRRNFWNISSGGPGSGLFRSRDGGDTWEEISRAPGLPDSALGKIGVSVSPARAGRVWALIEAVGDKTGLYRSDDAGGRWTQVSSNRDLMHRPWYYTHVFADPGHADTVYVTNLGMWKSTDGGQGWTEINTPHGDNHDLWIDPADPRRMIEGNDGGANVSFNGGLTWSSIYNQPTAQFYRIDVDDRHPYRVFGTQQDNTSIAVPSAAPWGAIALGDCTYPGTGESGFIAVKPDDPDIVYVGAVGSSPGGAGALQRYDYRTGSIQLVNVWPEEATGVAPRDLRYRFAWTFPIVFCPHDPNMLYAAGNHVFRTTNEGLSWQEISPDLSHNDRSRQGHSGGDITRESAGAEVHATCACVAPSPHRRGEIWASTDDGRVHVTRDDGATWHDVTPPGLPELAYVGCVDVSAHDADTVYVSATRYKLCDYRPYLFRTRDGGASWQAITGDLPDDQITRVVRADPVRPGLLFVGTETGVFHSADDGATWARTPGGLPVVPVYDLKIRHGDLVAGTHGRSFWILDDLSALRDPHGGPGTTHLVPPRPAIRTRLHFRALGGLKPPVSFGLTFGIGGGIAVVEQPDGSKRREHLDVGENPPAGAVLWYWLGAAGPVALTIRDASGAEVASWRSDDDALPADRRPSARAGLNRHVWDLRRPGPCRLDPPVVPHRNRPLHKEPEYQPGPVVLPGTYRVELSAGGQVQAAALEVRADPRLSTSMEDWGRQADLLARLYDATDRLNRGVNRIRRLRRQALALADRAEEAVAARARDLDAKLRAIEGAFLDLERQSPRDVLRNPAGLADTLANLVSQVGISDTRPTDQSAEVARLAIARVDARLAEIEALEAGDVASLNAAAGELPHLG